MKKLVCLVLSLVLCLMMAATACAYEVKELVASPALGAGDVTVKAIVLAGADLPFSADKINPELDCAYGTTQIGQYINQKVDKSLKKAYIILDPTTSGVKDGVEYKVKFPNALFDASHDSVQVYYATYNPNDKDAIGGWVTKKAEHNNLIGDEGKIGIVANGIPLMNGSVPVVLAWKAAGTSAGGVGPSTPEGPSTPAGGSVDMSNVNMPQTGDESNMMLWAALAMMSVAGLGLMLRKREAA